MKLSYALEGYWLARRRDFSKNTIRDYELTFRRFLDFCGDVDVEEVTGRDVNGFLNHLAEDLELSGKTQSNAWTALSSFWTWAEVELEIRHAIRGRVKRPSYKRRRPQPFTEQEVRLLLSACDQMAPWISPRGKRVQAARPTATRDRAIMLTMLDTGIRVSELCDLRLGDYDQRNGSVWVKRGKGDKSRTLYVAQTAQNAIWRYLADRGQLEPEAPLFAASTEAKLDRVAVLRMVQRAGDRVGVDNAHPHRFRHTFAIWFLRNGGNVLELQQLLGHERMETVRIYVELAAVDLEKATQKASPVDNWKL